MIADAHAADPIAVRIVRFEIAGNVRPNTVDTLRYALVKHLIDDDCVSVWADDSPDSSAEPDYLVFTSMREGGIVPLVALRIVDANERAGVVWRWASSRRITTHSGVERYGAPTRRTSQVFGG